MQLPTSGVKNLLLVYRTKIPRPDVATCLWFIESTSGASKKANLRHAATYFWFIESTSGL